MDKLDKTWGIIEIKDQNHKFSVDRLLGEIWDRNLDILWVSDSVTLNRKGKMEEKNERKLTMCQCIKIILISPRVCSYYKIAQFLTRK